MPPPLAGTPGSIETVKTDNSAYYRSRAVVP